MPKGLDQDELIERWTLVGEELERCRAKRGVNGLAFAVLWKFFLQHARFPRGRSEVADEAVGFVARQLQLSASELGFPIGRGALSSGTAPRCARCSGSASARSPTRTPESSG